MSSPAVCSQLHQLTNQNSHPSAEGKTWSQKASLEPRETNSSQMDFYTQLLVKMVVRVEAIRKRARVTLISESLPDQVLQLLINAHKRLTHQS